MDANVMVLAEAKDGDVVQRILRHASGDYYLDYFENGFNQRVLMQNLDHALREFSTAVRETDKWTLVAEVREFEREQAKLMREEV